MAGGHWRASETIDGRVGGKARGAETGAQFGSKAIGREGKKRTGISGTIERRGKVGV